MRYVLLPLLLLGLGAGPLHTDGNRIVDNAGNRVLPEWLTSNVADKA